jgi:plasmid stabilization system protein ParE
MAYKVIWSPKAEKTFDIVIDYLQRNWTNKQIKTFITETQWVLRMLTKNPYMFRGSEKENIHETLITKHNLVLYQINNKEKKVELLSFFDTRKDPKKKPL